MKFRNFLDEATKVYTSFQAAQSEAAEKLEQARAERAKVRNNRASTAGDKLVADERYQAAQKAYNASIVEAKNLALIEFNRLQEGVSAASGEFLRVNPAMMDANGVALLNSGVLSAGDLRAMAKEYGGNATMLRLIAGAADKLGDDREAMELSTQVKEFLDTDARERVFENGLRQIMYGLSADQNLTTRLGATWSRIGGQYGDALDGLEAFAPTSEE